MRKVGILYLTLIKEESETQKAILTRILRSQEKENNE